MLLRASGGKKYTGILDEPFCKLFMSAKGYLERTALLNGEFMTPPDSLTFIWCVRWPCDLPFEFCEVLVHQVDLYLVFARLKGLRETN